MFKKIILFLSFYCAVFAQGEKINLDEEQVININYDVVKENKMETASSQRLMNQTKATAILSLATVGILYALPEDFTGWDRDEVKNLKSKYNKNLVKRGFVWDPDNLFFNFIGHPYVGAVYYIAARKSGYDEYDSFLYSFFMSSIFWEMGIEAMAEAPSIQDIVITPGAGAILGEYLFKVEGKIINNDGKIGNSKFLGKTALVFIDPIGTLANKMGFKDDEVQGAWTFLPTGQKEIQLAYNLKVNF